MKNINRRMIGQKNSQMNGLSKSFASLPEQKYQKISSFDQLKDLQKQGQLSRLNSFLSCISEMEAQKNQQVPDQNLLQKNQLKEKKQQQKQLKKSFPYHNHLPIESLRSVKNRLQQIEKTQSTKFFQGCSQDVAKIRMGQCSKIIRMIFLILEDRKIRRSQDQWSLIQRHLHQGQDSNIIEHASKVGQQIQDVFFTKLYKKQQKRPGEAYRKQLDLVLKQLLDKNNTIFHQRIINRQEDLIRLSKAKEEQIICEQTKAQQKQRLQQIIRQASRLNQNIPLLSESSSEQPELVYHTKSASDFYKQSQETVKQIEFKQKTDYISKNKIICKKTWKILQECRQKMRARMQNISKIVNISK